jgi:hypothetical protein
MCNIFRSVNNNLTLLCILEYFCKVTSEVHTAGRHVRAIRIPLICYSVYFLLLLQEFQKLHVCFIMELSAIGC